MGSSMIYRIGLVVLASLSAESCIAASPGDARPRSAGCLTVTADDLWRNPPQFVGKRVCLFGYLGRMVPYGEASPEVFSTREDAESTYSDRRVTLGIPFTIPVQERLSRRSGQQLRAEGVFELETPCILAAIPVPDGSVCNPAPSMRIVHPHVAFINLARSSAPPPRTAEHPLPRAHSSDAEDRIPGAPVGTSHDPSRPNDQNEQPQ